MTMTNEVVKALSESSKQNLTIGFFVQEKIHMITIRILYIPVKLI